MKPKAYCIALAMGLGFFKEGQEFRAEKEGQEARTFCLEIAEGYNRELGRCSESRLCKLDTLFQSSALVECIQFIIRP